MLLSIKELEVKKIVFDTTLEPGQFDFSGADVRQITPLHAEGVAELLPHSDGEVRIKGRLTVTMEAGCDRCLGTAQYGIDQAFDLFYEPSAKVADEDEIAIDAAAAEIGFYQGAGIELNDILAEQVLLQLPMQRICKEECLGICAVCGKNRNESGCACVEVPADDRWSALRSL